MPRRASRTGPFFLCAALLIVPAGRARAQAPQSPVCDLQVRHDCNGIYLDAAASRAGASPVASYRWKVIGAAGEEAQPDKTSYLNHPFRCPDGAGTCTLVFEVRAADAGGAESAPCRQSVEVTKCDEPPVCDVQAREDRDGIVIDASASRADAGIASLKVSAEDATLSVQPADRPNVFRAPRPARPGRYVFNIDIVDGDGVPVRCQAAAQVSEAPPAAVAAALPEAGAGPRSTLLILRAYAVGSHIAGESAHEEGAFASFRAEGTRSGAGVGLEVRTRTSAGSPGRWGFTFDVLDTSFDLKVRVDTGVTSGVAHEEVRLRPYLLGASYHLPLVTGNADVWFGPALGWVESSNAAFSVGALSFPERFEGGFGWSLTAGADVPLGRQLLLTGAVRTFGLTAKARGPSLLRLDLDPVMVTLGVGYRF